MAIKKDIPSSVNDQVYSLIKSLTKSEKRHFKLYATRTQQKSDDLKFIQLFDLIDKSKQFKDELAQQKIGIKKSHVASMKRHLYKQILTSLRLLHKKNNLDIEIREQLDYARILYGKGLYMQSLKLLERIRITADNQHLNILSLEIMEFQKMIEERHITRSRGVEGKMESLTELSERKSEVIRRSCKLSNLKIDLHGYYIKHGHARNSKEAEEFKATFSVLLNDAQRENLGFFEHVFLHQSYVWYYYILLDFERCYLHAKGWRELFDENPNMKEEDPDLYMRGFHYEMTSLNNMDRVIDFKLCLEKFQHFLEVEKPRLSTTSEIIAFLYLNYAKLDLYILIGELEEGIELIPFILDKIETYQDKIDRHRILVFSYKIAYLYLVKGDYDKATDYLNQIIDLPSGHLREDIQCYARLMLLIAHYEMEHYELMDYLSRSTQRFIDKMEQLNTMQKTTIKLFRDLSNTPLTERQVFFENYLLEMKKIGSLRSGKRAFLYLDIPTWLESKVQKQSMGELLQNKFKKIS